MEIAIPQVINVPAGHVTIEGVDADGLVHWRLGPEAGCGEHSFDRATRAARAVVEAGGSMERCVEAFRRTLYSIGDPASCLLAE